MTKNEFLSALREQLAGLPQEDIEHSLDFYAEAIEDRVEDGMSEEEAVSSLGVPKEIASRIIADIPLSRLVKNKLRPRRKLGAFTIVLLIIGSPIWLSLLAAALVIALSVYAIIWAAVISLYAVCLTLASCAVAGIFCLVSYATSGNLAGGIAFLGAGIFCAGLFFFALLGTNRILYVTVFISKKLFLWIKSLFARKEAQA